MAALNDEVKAFVVQRLACFDTPSRVVEAVKESYDVETSRQQIQVYDPTRGKKPAPKWCALFDATRKAYVESAASIGIAHRTFRLEALQRMADAAEKRGNLLMAKDIYKQAAEEVGDVYTNRRHLNVEPREALAKLLGVSPDELPAAGTG
jgi:hypothetical protein